MNQVWNPYLPLNKYIPDGEPHVFGDRLYVFGSQDKEGGETFCMLDYEGFSAPISDLSQWRCEGVLYRADQDPDYSEEFKYLYAPDVVEGCDGRYYLYYALAGGAFTAPIHVAVCDTPAGQYRFYGKVRNKNGSVYRRHITFDPSVINDNGIIRLYYGWALSWHDEIENGKNREECAARRLQTEMKLFGKTKEEIENEAQGIQGAFVVELADDMLTVQSDPQRIIPGKYDAEGTGFQGHAFFEASSIRKINNIYYFIYSSEKLHELCYATSLYPDRDFVYQGTIISNGDIGYQGRLPEKSLAVTGNNHGGIVLVNDQWYIFYHRHTHKNSFSRQGCAEKITIQEDGSILQTEMTSSGLNQGPLRAEGAYPAVIACNLTNHNFPVNTDEAVTADIPYVTHEGAEQFITDISDDTRIGYKYFRFTGRTELTLWIKGEAVGVFEVFSDDELAGKIKVEPAIEWTRYSAFIEVHGVKALYLNYKGTGKVSLIKIEFTSK